MQFYFLFAYISLTAQCAPLVLHTDESEYYDRLPVVHVPDVQSKQFGYGTAGGPVLFPDTRTLAVYLLGQSN